MNEQLPPLPHLPASQPYVWVWIGGEKRFESANSIYFTADQMRDYARAALAANEKVPSRATDIATALALPGCERLKEWAEIGPVQRAAVEEFAYAMAAKVPADLTKMRNALLAIRTSIKFKTLADEQRTLIEAALAAKVPAGYKLVPIEPTPAMLDAGADAGNDCDWSDMEPVWAAMLAATPAPAPEADTRKLVGIAYEMGRRGADIDDLERELGSAPAQAQQPLTVPHPGSPEASALIDSELALQGWPGNPKKAAQAGYEACRKLLGAGIGASGEAT